MKAVRMVSVLTAEMMRALLEPDEDEVSRQCEPSSFVDLSAWSAIDDAAATELGSSGKTSADLSGLQSISTAAAKSLAGLTGSLNLRGLQFLNQEVARELSRSQADWLNLSGLVQLTSAEANCLARFPGDLLLNGLQRIDDSAANALADFQGTGLSLTGLVELDRSHGHMELASACGRLRSMQFPGLKSLSTFAASRLVKYSAPLALPVLENVSLTLASVLAKHQGQQVVSAETLRNEGVVRILSHHRGRALCFAGPAPNISDDVARVLIASPADLSISGLSSLNEDPVSIALLERLIRGQKELRFDSVVSLTRRATSVLAESPSSRLSLNGLHGLRIYDSGDPGDSHAEGLSRFKGDLYLGSIRNLSCDDLRRLCSGTARVHLPELRHVQYTDTGRPAQDVWNPDVQPADNMVYESNMSRAIENLMRNHRTET